MIGGKSGGIASARAFEAGIAHGADWIGFVFFERSPRAITPARAAALSGRQPGGAGRIGLFVGASNDEIAACLDRTALDGLQIYDTAERAQAIRERFGLPVWLACAVGSATDLPGAATCDRLMIESRPRAGSTRPGGNGVALDWAMLHGWNAPGPWMLAGGLDPGNVAEAIRQSGAPAVDVSSGVERGPGVKDPARIAAFIQAARKTQDKVSPASRV